MSAPPAPVFLQVMAAGPRHQTLIPLSRISRKSQERPSRDHACEADLARGEGHDPAPGGVEVIVAAVDHQNIAGPGHLERDVADGAVIARHPAGHSCADDDPSIGDHRPEIGVHEAVMADVADRRRLHLQKLLTDRRVDLRRHIVHDIHPGSLLLLSAGALILGRAESRSSSSC